MNITFTNSFNESSSESEIEFYNYITDELGRINMSINMSNTCYLYKELFSLHIINVLILVFSNEISKYVLKI